MMLFVKTTKNRFGGKKFVEDWKKNLFFKDLLILCLQGYLEFIIAFIMVSKLDEHKIFGERLSVLMCMFSMFVAFILIPTGLYKIMRASKAQLKDKKFEDTWGPLFSTVKLNKESAPRAFYIVYIIRRVIYVSVAFYVTKPMIYQFLTH